MGVWIDYLDAWMDGWIDRQMDDFFQELQVNENVGLQR